MWQKNLAAIFTASGGTKKIGGIPKMKKKISILAAVLLALGLTACGNNESQASNDTTQTIQAESSQETETANDSCAD